MPLLSWVVDPPGTKGGPQAGNFPGPPKNTFCPRWRPFVPGEATTRDKRAFCPGWWLHPGQKGGPYISRLTSAFLQHLGIFLICAAPSSSPIARPAPPPSPSAARASPPPRPGRLGRRPRQAAHRCAAVPGPVPPRLRRPGLHSARAPSSSPPTAASTARRRAAILSAARHRAASSPPRRPGPPP